MKSAVRIPILILAGLLSVPLMEIAGILWMRAAPLNIDLTANYFAMVVLPMALLVHFLACLALWKIFEPSPKVGGVTYVGTHVVAQSAALTLMGNPPMDVLVYCIILLFSGSLTQFVFHRYFWCPHCAGPLLGGSDG
jgi:hypothetical protein